MGAGCGDFISAGFRGSSRPARVRSMVSALHPGQASLA